MGAFITWLRNWPNSRLQRVAAIAFSGHGSCCDQSNIGTLLLMPVAVFLVAPVVGNRGWRIRISSTLNAWLHISPAQKNPQSDVGATHSSPLANRNSSAALRTRPYLATYGPAFHGGDSRQGSLQFRLLAQAFVGPTPRLNYAGTSADRFHGLSNRTAGSNRTIER